MRAGTELFADEIGGAPVGQVTSGAFGPSIDRPMSMGYVAAAYAAPGTRLFGEVRGKRLPAIITPMPFHPTTYKR
jgi:aminomethyltransferase